MFSDVVDIQSIGAAIRTCSWRRKTWASARCGSATSFTPYEELCQWLGEPGEMIAACRLAMPTKSPIARARKPLREVSRVA
jgi:hypothetical protein